MTRGILHSKLWLVPIVLGLVILASGQATAGYVCSCSNLCFKINCGCGPCDCLGPNSSCGCGAPQGGGCPPRECYLTLGPVTLSCDCGGPGCVSVCPDQTFCFLHAPSPFAPCGDLVDCICGASDCGTCDKHCASAGDTAATEPCGGSIDCASDDGCAGPECGCGSFCPTNDMPCATCGCGCGIDDCDCSTTCGT